MNAAVTITILSLLPSLYFGQTEVKTTTKSPTQKKEWKNSETKQANHAKTIGEAKSVSITTPEGKTVTKHYPANYPTKPKKIEEVEVKELEK